MFTADDIQARVRARPFTPFRIVTSSGQMFDVSHPDLVLIGRREIVVGAPSTEEPTQFEHLNRLAIMHVTALQDLSSSVSPGSGNGHQ